MKLQIRDAAGLRGCFRMKVYRRGVLIETREDRNLVVNSGRSLVTRLITGGGNGAYINRIAFGTSGNLPVPHDAEITAPFIKAVDGVSYPAFNQALIDWSLAVTEANGMEIREFGLLRTDGALFARRTRERVIYKEPDIALEGQWILTMREDRDGVFTRRKGLGSGGIPDRNRHPLGGRFAGELQ